MDDILNKVSLYQLFQFADKINRRRLMDYKMQLAIIRNPHTENPDNLVKILDQGFEDDPEVSYAKRKAEFDEAGFELLKSKLMQNPRFVVK